MTDYSVLVLQITSVLPGHQSILFPGGRRVGAGQIYLRGKDANGKPLGERVWRSER